MIKDERSYVFPYVCNLAFQYNYLETIKVFKLGISQLGFYKVNLKLLTLPIKEEFKSMVTHLNIK